MTIEVKAIIGGSGAIMEVGVNCEVNCEVRSCILLLLALIALIVF
jgi:hypothetical protein